MTHTDRDTDVTVCERPTATRDETSSSGSDGALDGQHAVVRDQLSDYYDGSLPAPERARLQQHLDLCASCCAFWASFRHTVEATRRLPTHSLSHDAKRHLLDQVARLGERAQT